MVEAPLCDGVYPNVSAAFGVEFFVKHLSIRSWGSNVCWVPLHPQERPVFNPRPDAYSNWDKQIRAHAHAQAHAHDHAHTREAPRDGLLPIQIVERERNVSVRVRRVDVSPVKSKGVGRGSAGSGTVADEQWWETRIGIIIDKQSLNVALEGGSGQKLSNLGREARFVRHL